MTGTPCRWHRLLSGLACNREPGRRSCTPTSLEGCGYPGFEQTPLPAGACDDCEHRDAPALPRRERPLPPRKAVVMDRPRGVGWRGQTHASCHLACQDLERLHAFAALVGLKREWFQEGKTPHYDVIGGALISEVMRAGAVIVSRYDLVRVAEEGAR